MFVSFGILAFYAGMILIFASLCIGFLKKFIGNIEHTIKLQSTATTWSFLLITIALSGLIFAHITDDFSVINVIQYSNTKKPMIYKWAAVWGNHEGSMLLSLWFLSLYMSAFTLFSRINNLLKLYSNTLLSALSCAIGIYIINTSNPFVRVWPIPSDGMGFNPVLQDFALTIHPPILYAGYMGFSISFAIVVSMLLTHTKELDWYKILRPWIIIPWIFLTIGVALGSWWAYRELGWGGFWFWDPVENLSIIPWLIGLAVYHMLIIVQKESIFIGSTLILTASTFMSAITGIFLVRSGMLMSVHSFIANSSRVTGLGMILSMLFIITIISFWRGSRFIAHLKENKNIEKTPNIGLSRHNLIAALAILTTIASISLLFGILYPLLSNIISKQTISINTSYFKASFIPLALCTIFIASFATYVPWLKINIQKAWYKWRIDAFSALVLAALIYHNHHFTPVVFLYLFTANVIIIASLRSLFNRLAAGNKPSPTFLSMIISHTAIGIILMGITITTNGGAEITQLIKPRDTINFANFSIKYHDHKLQDNQYYKAQAIDFEVKKLGKLIGYLHPETRYYKVENTFTHEMDVLSIGLSNLDIVVTGISDKEIEVTIYWRPYINLIWLGILLLSIGASIGVIGRYYKTKRSL